MLIAVRLALYYLTLGATLAGIAYYLIAAASIRRLRRTRASERSPVSLPPMSLLKPLHGADPGWRPTSTAFSHKTIRHSSSSLLSDRNQTRQ
jgi:hypothetical protein